MSESVESFAARIAEHAGLQPQAIPDGAPSDLLGGAIVATSPHGTLVLVDPIGQDDDGYTRYGRALLVERGPSLPPADPSATGACRECEPFVAAEVERAAVWIVGSALTSSSAHDLDVVYCHVDREEAIRAAREWLLPRPLPINIPIDLHQIPVDGAFIALAEHEPSEQIWGKPRQLPRTVPRWTGTAIRYWLRYKAWPIWAEDPCEAREHDAAIVMAVDAGLIGDLRAAMASGAWEAIMAGEKLVTLSVRR